jgi:hypothetical protein
MWKKIEDQENIRMVKFASHFFEEEYSPKELYK